MTLNNWRYLKSKWLILVDVTVCEIYTIDEQLYIYFHKKRWHIIHI